jgi:hypothetical protein
MKTKIIVICLLVSSSTFLYAQNEPSKKLPPMKMLPKEGEVKKIFELYDEVDYAIFDKSGATYQTGKAEFIDYTDFPEGAYFIRYTDENGKLRTEKFEK